MKKLLEIGVTEPGRAFTLPLDFVTRTCGIIAIRGAGKTVTATVIAEEMCEAGLPWIAFDPAGVWWGLRVNKDGTAGGYPVLIVGGQHGDLPLKKDAAPRLAEALVANNVCCVIDLKLESKNVFRGFVADFCDRLMELQPQTPRHVFFEEAPELVPQKPMGEQKRSLASVDRLIRLGRNQGYGATLISQRFATIQKDVLTQCENLIAMRTPGKPDRKAAQEWIAECVQPTPGAPQVKTFLDSLSRLADGEGWFWSPQWLDVFDLVQFRDRKTYHPGQTRSVGQAAQQVKLSDVSEFVEAFRPILEEEEPKAHVTVDVDLSKGRVVPQPIRVVPPSVRPEVWERKIAQLQEETAKQKAMILDLGRQIHARDAVIAGIRTVLEPQYRAMSGLFSDLATLHTDTNGAIDRAVFEPWLLKLPFAAPRILNVLIERGGRATISQIGTLISLSPSGGYFRRSLPPLERNGLVRRNGDELELIVP